MEPPIFSHVQHASQPHQRWRWSKTAPASKTSPPSTVTATSLQPVSTWKWQISKMEAGNKPGGSPPEFATIERKTTGIRYNRLHIIEIKWKYQKVLWRIILVIIWLKYEIPPSDVCFLGVLALFSGSSWTHPLQDCLLQCRVCSPASMSSTIRTFAPKMLLSPRSTLDG